MSDSDSEDYMKIKKYINNDTDSDSKKKKNTYYLKMNNNDKIIFLCKKLDINIFVNNSDKIKPFIKIIKLCDEKKRDLIKQCSLEIANFGTKKGYTKLAGTYELENLTDKFVTDLRITDKIINLCKKEYNPNNILLLMNIKKKKEKIDISDFILETFSDNK